jgi:hypothetical protein
MQTMRQNPERLAWVVLWLAFITFCLIAVGCPASAYSYMLHARRGLHAQLNSQRGTVRVERTGSSRVDAVSLDDPPLRLYSGDGVRTGNLNEALLTWEKRDQEQREILGTVKIYENSDVVLVDAHSPRFGFSTGGHEATLQIRGGRVRIEVQTAGDGRPVQVQVHSDHARLLLSQGSYALDVTNQQTAVVVRHGQASVRAGEQELSLNDEQRAIASLQGQLDGPLPAEQNLIVNGDFSQGESAWIQDIDSPDPSGRVVITQDDGGQSFAQLLHDQPQPSEVSLIQTLNRDVSDMASLVLHLKVRVNAHSLSVCGDKGTECPVMVRVDYIDVAGGENLQQWVHGFYAYEDPGLNIELPYNCTTCPQPSSGNHNQVSWNTWFLYDSPNLMEIQPEKIRPARIQSIRVYASGHIYDSMVTDIELLAQE